MSNIKNKRNQRFPSVASQKKVKLTDLCTEQKSKVGELIFLIEKYRQENKNLDSQNRCLKQENHQLKNKIMRLEFENKKQDQRVQEMVKIMDDVQQHLNKKDEQIKKYKKRDSSGRDVSVETQREIVTNICQKNHPQNSFININTQTEENQFVTFTQSPEKNQSLKKSKPKTNSKAYKKIMTSLHSISKAVDEKLSKSKSIHQSLIHLSSDQQFSDLARLWLRIKKQKKGQKFITNPYKSIDSVNSSNHQESVCYQQQDISNPHDPIDQFDLNKMLKQKGFKANEMLKSTGRNRKDIINMQYS